VWQHEKRLRMTKEEVKQEHKETEGDPMIRSRRRSLARTMLRRQMFADVANADVVVTNPTHIAVALKYDAGVAAAPIGLAMGQREERVRLTQGEGKQEHKETEGDPMIRSRRRSLARTMLRRQMFADVANADVVVTNPTHIAVALKYDAGVAAAPIVLAMGQRKI